jgi:hypothetical protein
LHAIQPLPGSEHDPQSSSFIERPFSRHMVWRIGSPSMAKLYSQLNRPRRMRFDWIGRWSIHRTWRWSVHWPWRWSFHRAGWRTIYGPKRRPVDRSGRRPVINQRPHSRFGYQHPASISLQCWGPVLGILQTVKAAARHAASRPGADASGLAWSRLLRFRRCLPVHAFHCPQHGLGRRWRCIAFA